MLINLLKIASIICYNYMALKNAFKLLKLQRVLHHQLHSLFN